MDLDQPLSESEFDELDQFLVSDATPDDCMDISMLDGFLTALAVGPNLLLPNQWLPEVYGESEQEKVKWASPAQAEHMLGLILRHMNDIIWQLREAPDEYEPIVLEGEQEDGEVVSIIDEWCIGFMEGVHVDEAAWASLFESAEEQAFLLPIILYGTESGRKQLESRPELAARQEQLADSLADCVLAIQDYWLPQRRAAMTVRREQEKTGRNDPCPCGSGRKFKKCCGDASRLH
jgi:uncharacterized protein